MPGGNKNIKPEDGKQFSKEYQPPEKWNEKAALKVGKKLIKWLRKKPDNIFFKDFLLIECGYSINLICYLSKKFSSFDELIKQAKDIQEVKLVKYGCLDRLNSQMTKFTLINNHGWKDKKDFDHTSKNKKITPFTFYESE